METKKQVDITNEFGDGKYLHILANPVLDEHKQPYRGYFQERRRDKTKTGGERTEESERESGRVRSFEIRILGEYES